MPNIVGIRFKEAGKVYYFDPAGWSWRRVTGLSWRPHRAGNAAR